MASFPIVVIILLLLLSISIGTHNKLVIGSLGPSMIFLLFFVTINLSLQNVHTQSTLQSTGTESKFCLMLGSTCAFLACCGSISKGSSFVFVDPIGLLFEHSSFIGSYFISFLGNNL